MSNSQSILVPLSNSPASLEAVRLAALIAKQRKSRIYVLHVIEVLRSLPLTAEMEPEARRGEQLLRRAQEVAASVGAHISGELIQARDAGQAIVEEATERKNDLIVMSIGSQGPIVGAYDMSETVDFVLRHAPCEVLLLRQALQRLEPHE